MINMQKKIMELYCNIKLIQLKYKSNQKSDIFFDIPTNSKLITIE